MAKLHKRVASLLAAAALMLAAMPLGSVSAAADVVNIYHTNDMHGSVEAAFNEETNEIEKPGLDHVAALHAADENSLLVDAGDFSQGTLFANMAHGLSVVEAMNAAGYDLAALGNHEFDFSVAELEANLAAAEFEVISANVTIDEAHAADFPLLAGMPQYVVKTVGERQIAFFSVDTPELNGMVSPATLSAGGVQVRTDISALAAEIVDAIQAEVPDVDAIIAVTHCGMSEGGAGETSYDLAGVEGITAVIDGHDHQLRLGDSAVDVNGTLIVSTGCNLENVGCLTLDFSGGEVAVSSSNVAADAMAAEPVAAVTEVIDSWNAEFEEIKSEVVFSSEINFWGGNLSGITADGEEIQASVARRGETNAGSLVADARRWKALNWLAENWDSDAYAEFGLTEEMPVVVLGGGGSVRGSFGAGEVTLGQLMTAYSFGFEDAEDTYVLITPKIMYDMIEHGVNIFLGQDTETGMLDADGSIHGRFPQASGFTYVYDITQPASTEYDKDALTMPTTIGSRVQSITLEDGTVLDKNDNETPMLLVASDYEIGGGDSYWMIGALNEAENYGGYQYVPAIATPAGNYGDTVIDYVNEVYGGTIPADAYPINSGRITRVNDPYTGEGFTTSITVTDGGQPLAGAALTATVNGVESAVTADDAGVVSLDLANGPSEIRLTGEGYDSGALYLDNYCGLYNAVAENVAAASSGDAEAPASSAAQEPAQGGGEIGVVLVPVFAFVLLVGLAFAANSKKKKQ